MAIKNTVPMVLRNPPTYTSDEELKKDLSNIILGFSLYYWLIPCTLVNKQTEEIILSNHSPQTMTCYTSHSTSFPWK